MMHTRYSILDQIPKINRDQPRHIDNLNEYMNYLKNALQIAGAKQITNHTVQETQAASSLFIPFIKLILLSCNVLEHISETKDILNGLLTKTGWDTLGHINSSDKVKQTAAMHVLKYETASEEKLLSITTEKFSYFPCKRLPLEVPEVSTLSQATRHITDITAIELLGDYLQSCIIFLPFDKVIHTSFSPKL